MAHGVVALLDQETTASTIGVWEELEVRWGLRGIRAVPIPHVTLLASDDLDLTSAADRLADLASARGPVATSTDAWGIFTGPGPKLPAIVRLVSRTADLDGLHRVTRSELAGAGAFGKYYDETSWIPHITIASRGVTPSEVGDVATWLAAEPQPAWQITITDLALLEDVGGSLEVRESWRLAG